MKINEIRNLLDAVDTLGVDIGQIWWHGSKVGGFTKFDKKYVGSGIVGSNTSGGFYFTDDKEAAKFYSDVEQVEREDSDEWSYDDINVYGEDEYYFVLNDINLGPYESEELARKEGEKLVDKHNDSEVGDIIHYDEKLSAYFLNFKNPLIVDNITDFRKAERSAEADGYDGIIGKDIYDGDMVSTVAVVFDSSLIRSVSGLKEGLGLDMDKTSRYARARSMGFDTDTIWYHGTSGNIKRFKTTTNGAAEGVYLTTSPLHAGNFSRKEGGNIIAVFVRGNIGTRDDMLAAVGSATNRTQEMITKGLDGYNDRTHSELIIFDPSNIRSIHAKFDVNSSSNDLLEGLDAEAEAYAEAHGLGEISWAGSGDMGTAYHTEKDTILKITRDDTELKNARMLVGKDLSNVIKIYDVEGSIIHMEELDMDHVEDLYGTAMSYAEYGDIMEIDTEDHVDMPRDVRKFIEEIQFGAMQLERVGILNLDLKDNNIGRKPNGEYAIFDMSSIKAN